MRSSLLGLRDGRHLRNNNIILVHKCSSVCVCVHVYSCLSFYWEFLRIMLDWVEGQANDGFLRNL